MKMSRADPVGSPGSGSVVPGGLRPLLLAAVIALLAGASPATSEEPKGGVGDLLVAPPRVVFEGRTRTAEITLVNTGTRTATYRVSFVQLRMDENGVTREIETPEGGELFADGLVRFSPRQVTLEPKATQTVRLQVRKPADLPPGEYRSHLLFRAPPPTAGPGADGSAPAAEEGMSIQLIPIYGISIPIIVRQGEASAVVTMSDLVLAPPVGTDTTPFLRLRMSRTGPMSVYGNLTVTFQPRAGKPTVVGLANGVAVWAPYPARNVGIPLRPPADLDLRGGVFRVTYTRPDKRDETLAEAELRIP
jgi:hypothetical protein